MTTSSLAEQAQDRLGEALAELVLAQEAENPGDRESRRYLLHDMNSLLQRVGAGPGSELQSPMLARPNDLSPHLRASLEIPAQALAKELPNRLRQWLKEEPKPNSPDRPGWAEHGRWLLEQVSHSRE